MDDIDRVLRIAKRYEIQVYLSDSFVERMTEPPSLFEPTAFINRGLTHQKVHRHATGGPKAHWCHPESRTVWFDNLRSSEVETHLHEICHVIMNPPGGIDELSEDVVLMPFERMLAKQCLSAGAVTNVLDWQESGTQIEWWDEKRDKFLGALEEVPNYRHHFFWRQSHAALRRMGVVKDRRVTWKYPNWKRASKDLMSRGNLI